MKKISNKLTSRCLIFFYGEADSGKTTTLKEFATTLLRDSDAYCDTRITQNCNGNPISSSDREITIDWRGVSFFVRTIGDSKNEVRNNIKQFGKSGRTIGIIASHWASTTFQNQGAGIKFFDIPRVKQSAMPNNRSGQCYTTASELYLHVLHLIKTGTFN